METKAKDWRCYDNGPALGDIVIRDRDKEEVALVRFNSADWRENACLVAAAPDLLAAAEAVLEAAIYDTRNLKLNVELDKLRAATSAAKGKARQQKGGTRC